MGDDQPDKGPECTVCKGPCKKDHGQNMTKRELIQLLQESDERTKIVID